MWRNDAYARFNFIAAQISVLCLYSMGSYINLHDGLWHRAVPKFHPFMKSNRLSCAAVEHIWVIGCVSSGQWVIGLQSLVKCDVIETSNNNHSEQNMIIVFKWMTSCTAEQKRISENFMLVFSFWQLKKVPSRNPLSFMWIAVKIVFFNSMRLHQDNALYLCMQNFVKFPCKSIFENVCIIQIVYIVTDIIGSVF